MTENDTGMAGGRARDGEAIGGGAIGGEAIGGEAIGGGAIGRGAIGGGAVADSSLLSPETGERLAKLALLSRRAGQVRHRGRRRTVRIGAGADRRDTRVYAPGDDPRRIAWPAFARLERLVVWLTADEAPLRLALLLDTSASMGFGRPTKLRQASCVAAGLAAVALSGEDRCAVIAASEGRWVSQRTVGGGRQALVRILSMLESLRASGSTDLAAAAAAVSSVAGGRALCVILSDLFDPAGALAAARAARSRGHEVAIVEVLDEIDYNPPNLDGMDLFDEETGEIVAMPESGARAAYLRELCIHQSEVDRQAAALEAIVLRVTTAQPFDEIVMQAMQCGLLRAGGTR